MKNPFRRGPKPIEQVEDSFIVKVWKAPADFNRGTRRQARLFGRLWKWDARALGLNPTLPPRYARRHYDITKFTTPRTRRQRRHRARIIAMMKQRGEA